MLFTLTRLRHLRPMLLITGLAAGAPCLAEETTMGELNVTMTANIVDNTCQISLSDNGEVHLPTVSRYWFYKIDGTTPRLQPNDAASGTRFSVNVESCDGKTDALQTMTFRFKPQSGSWPAESKQVFMNETPTESGGAQNVGVVIFSSNDNRNVVDSNGDPVAMFAAAPDTYLASYDFYARYQNTSAVISSGKVTSHVLVDAIYQ
ncbi:fimbrial-like protein [Citrobacter youngae]|nr:fimbrial-like protein [Citrobacter youngae]